MKRLHLLPTIVLILCLGVAEYQVLSLLWPSKPSEQEKIARLEKLLAEKDYELNQLIIERDRNQRKAPVAVQNMSSDPEAELEQATVRASKQGAGPVKAPATTRPTPENVGVDAEHLVLVTNMLSGSQRAKLIKNNGKTAIQYPSGPWDANDPVWKVFDTAIEGDALGKVYLSGKADVPKIREELISYGIPSQQIEVRPNSQGKDVIIEIGGGGA